MEIDWRQRQWEGYVRDGRAALTRFAGGERSPAFLGRILELLRTYLEGPAAAGARQCDDEVMVRLALGIHHHVYFAGYWPQMVRLWPQLCQRAAQLANLAFYSDLTRQWASLVANSGDLQSACLIYAQLIHSPTFARLPTAIQADILVNAGTSSLWSGRLAQAKALLEQCLVITDAYCTHNRHALADQTGIFSPTYSMRLWEVRAYALNQLGCYALFQGAFGQAEQYYQACQSVLIQHGEADNLVCVAYQALGRLRLYQGRWAEAIAILDRGLAIRRRRQEQEGIAVNTAYLAAAHLALGDLTQAETLLTTALGISRTLNMPQNRALCHLYFGQLHRLRGEDLAALEQWRQALAILRTVHMPLVEQRVLLIYLPWLVRTGAWRMVLAVAHQLFRTAFQQRLGPRPLWRLARQFSLPPKS